MRAVLAAVGRAEEAVDAYGDALRTAGAQRPDQWAAAVAKLTSAVQ